MKQQARKKILIVGGVAGGATAAAGLRRLDENAQMILFEKGAHISFANCGLPYYIGDVITSEEALLVTSPEKMQERFHIDVRVLNEVLHIDPQHKQITVKNLKNGDTYTETFDKLLLSPGAMPIKPPLPGIHSNKIFTLRDVPDAVKIRSYVDQHQPERAVVIGGGFIGLEVAENLVERGVKVTLIERNDQVLGPLDFEMAAMVHQHLIEKGMELVLNDGVVAFEEDAQSGKLTLTLTGGEKIQADITVMGIGVRPLVELAKTAGLAIGPSGGIAVNQHLQTSHPDIYAVGDAIEVTDLVSKKPVTIPLAGPANKQGRIAAINMNGGNETYEGTLGTAILKVFDLDVASVGNNEKLLRRNDIPYEKSYVHLGAHAGYYPNPGSLTLKLIFNKGTGEIYGAQCVGTQGVDKRIDVIATAMMAGLKVWDLEKLQLSYAPPYSSAKDPVNMAGYVAHNIIQEKVSVFHWHDVAALATQNVLFLDVRTPQEFRDGSLPGAVNMPVDTLRDRLSELPKDKPVYAFCAVGLRGYIASRILTQHGFSVKNLSGGYRLYHTATRK